MYDGPVYVKSFEYAREILKLYNLLNKHDSIISKQLLRSSTSIGANVHEATSAQSMNDFISKMSIALKEAKESGYWLRLIDESSLIEKDLTRLIDLNTEIIRLLTSIIKTSQQNRLKQSPRTKN